MLIDKNGYKYCSNKCQNEEIVEEKEVICPNCNKGHLVKRVATRGKNKGNTFYGCSNFPRCKTLISIEEYNKIKN